MAIYHLSVKAVSRKDGRSATAAAAYRAGARIEDERTGITHDYRRRFGVAHAELVLPESAGPWAHDRATLWNAAEAAERRKDSTIAREFEIALPAELDASQRRELALAFAREMAQRDGCAVDVCIHLPSREGNQNNHHAHMLRTTREVGPEGMGAKLLCEKTQTPAERELALIAWRERWAQMCNDALERAQHRARVDHRSLVAQGIEREPTQHHGPAETHRRRRGEHTPRTREDNGRAQRNTIRKRAERLEMVVEARARQASQAREAMQAQVQLRAQESPLPPPSDIMAKLARMLENRQAPSLWPPQGAQAAREEEERRLARQRQEAGQQAAEAQARQEAQRRQQAPKRPRPRLSAREMLRLGLLQAPQGKPVAPPPALDLTPRDPPRRSGPRM